MNKQYGLWNNEYFVYDGDKILVYHDNQRVASILLLQEKIQFLSNRLEGLTAKIGFDEVIETMYYGGMVLTASGAIINYSLEQSIPTLAVSCMLLGSSLGLGFAGLKKSHEISYDKVNKEVIKERLIREKQVLEEYEKLCSCKEFALKQLNSKSTMAYLDSAIEMETLERCKSKSLINRITQNIK